MKNIALVLGIVVVVVVGVVLSRETSILGTEVSSSAKAVNFTTSTAATFSDLKGITTQSSRLDCINTGAVDVYLGLGTTTNIHHSGVVLRASSSFSWTVDNGLLFNGYIYASGTAAATNNIHCTRIP